MFKTFKFTRKVENILMLIFTAIFLIYISLSPDMSIDSLKGVLVIGVTVGIIYGLVAVGISLIYTGLDVVNFSHGEFFMIGAFTGLTVYNFLVDGELIYAIFPEAYGVLGLPINIAGITLPMTYLWMLVTGFVVAGALYFFLNKTKMGLGVRAVAFSKDISNLVGINVPLYISIIFGIACALAGIAGTLVGPTYQVVVYMGYIILLKAFASAVVGGFGSLPGAIVGGFTVGLFETACSFFISGSHKDAYAFLLMVVVLLIKPTGFFGVQVKMKA